MTVKVVDWRIQKYRLRWPYCLVNPAPSISRGLSCTEAADAALSENGMSLQNVSTSSRCGWNLTANYVDVTVKIKCSLKTKWALSASDMFDVILWSAILVGVRLLYKHTKFTNTLTYLLYKCGRKLIRFTVHRHNGGFGNIIMSLISVSASIDRTRRSLNV